MRERMQIAFAPDVCVTLTTGNRFYIHRVVTFEGQKWSEAIRASGITDYDKACEHAANLGIEATVESEIL